jgi:hypothetical protein
MLLFWGKEAYLGFYVRECPMFQKYWQWPNEMATFGPKKRKEKHVGV